MSNFDPSPGTLLVWNMATEEARATGYPEIVADHFFLAICNVTSMPLFTIDRSSYPNLYDSREQIAEEIRYVRQVFQQVGLSDREGLCTRLRQKLGRRTPDPMQRMWHRSDSLKQLCEQAAAMARSTGSGKTGLGHLLLWLITVEEGCRIAALREEGVLAVALTAQIEQENLHPG